MGRFSLIAGLPKKGGFKPAAKDRANPVLSDGVEMLGNG
jgi:hypothetical protein